MVELSTLMAGEDMVSTPQLTYLVNMIDGEQYEITRDDYETLRGFLARDELSGIYIIKPDTPRAIILTVRNIVALGVEPKDIEEDDE